MKRELEILDWVNLAALVFCGGVVAVLVVVEIIRCWPL
jgi:hypothetical protein